METRLQKGDRGNLGGRGYVAQTRSKRQPFPGGTGELTRNEADVTTAVATSTPLTAADRCDRCGAQAYLRVELLSGGELLFCAHHAREHGDALKEVAATMVDETDKLAGTPAVAPDAER
jgi:hypothetical protein